MMIREIKVLWKHKMSFRLKHIVFEIKFNLIALKEKIYIGRLYLFNISFYDSYSSNTVSFGSLVIFTIPARSVIPSILRRIKSVRFWFICGHKRPLTPVLFETKHQTLKDNLKIKPIFDRNIKNQLKYQIWPTTARS